MNKIPLPEMEALLAAMKIAETSIEAADYLVKQFEEILRKVGELEKHREFFESVKEFADLVRLKLTASAQPWSGELGPSSDFHNMHINLAKDAANKLAEYKLAGHIGGIIKLDLAISNMSQLLRGYTVDGKALDPKNLKELQIIKELDVLNNAWLAQNNIVSKGGRLFEANSDGTIKTDAQGNPIAVDPEKMKKLAEHPEKGLVKFYQDHGVDMSFQLHKDVKEPMVEEQRKVVEKEIEVRSEVSARKEEPAEAAEEAPRSTGMSTGGG